MPTPIPSLDVNDFKANIQDFDAMANGTGVYTDRFGKERLTLDAFMAANGFEVPVAFASGIAVSRTTQAVTYEGNTYHALPSALPFTTTGTFNAAQWVLLRQNANNVTDGTLTIAGFTASALMDGAWIHFAGRDTVGDGGGGMFRYSASSTQPADGGTVFAPAGGGRMFRHVRDVLWDRVSVKDFGAIGDGLSHPLSTKYSTLDSAQVDYPHATALTNEIDWAAIQAALTFVGSARGVDLLIPSGKYLLSAPLEFRAATLPAALSGSDLHFSEHVESRIYGCGDARLIASTSMARMLLLKFNAGTSAIGPFYTTVTGLTFDAANLASTCIESDFTMHLSILKNKLWRPVVSGIKHTGYGVAKIRDNVIKAPICVNLAGGGGDSDVSANDMYPSARGVNIGNLGGDATISKNVFNGEGNAGCIGVYLDGVSAGAGGSVLNVRVLDNEFSGMVSGVLGKRNASARNIFGLRVCGNHTIPAAGGAVHTGQLVNLEGVDDLILTGNQINSQSISATISVQPGVQLSDCKNPMILGNKFANLLGPAAYFINTTDGVFAHNVMLDTGRAGASGVVVDVSTGTTGMLYCDNVIRQSSASYAQNPFYERAGANSNEFLRNSIFGCSARTTRVGAASVVAGRQVASGAYSLSGGVGTIQPNSHGFTINRTGVGVTQVTLANPRVDSNYRVQVCADSPQVAVDSYTSSTFIVRCFNAAGAAQDSARVQFDVFD